LNSASICVSLALLPGGAGSPSLLKGSMDDRRFQVRFWGTRGSLPVSGRDFERYGGNTACVEMRCGPHTLIFDAGSGIGPAGVALNGEAVDKFDLFFTHCHYDHIIGAPFFAPLYDPAMQVKVWSGHLAGRMTTLEMLDDFMQQPWFPVRINFCKALVQTYDFRPGDVLRPREGVTIRTANLDHPDGCVGYRVEWGGRAVVLASDTEHRPGKLNETIVELIRGADLVIYDCTYTEAEMPKKRNWGHSTWQAGAALCEAAGAKRLAMFHHEPSRTDAQLDGLESEAQQAFAGAFAARDGQIVDIG
jgi:phosphoribosyl 1,2-cyclic phosphodiesterase